MRTELEAQARASGVGLATFLRELAGRAARDARRVRIRQASAAVGEHVAAVPDVGGFYGNWGTPAADAG